MFGLGFFKGQPTEYIIHYAGGRKKREGKGLSFYYLKYNSQIVAVPTSSTDVHFIFNEQTSNFQAVTIQGQFSYRVKNPLLVAELLNFGIDFSMRYVSKDPELLSQRITNVIQMETRGEIHKRSLEEALRQSKVIAAKVLESIQQGGALDGLGIELLSIYFISMKPTPEVSKALEAEYREMLLRRADEAIYSRRASAVEEERKIKEKELSTAITLEEQRRLLIDLEGSNETQEAENRGKALEKESEYRAKSLERELGLYDALDPHVILALAMKGIGENAGKIGNLTITSEILAALLDGNSKRPS